MTAVYPRRAGPLLAPGGGVPLFLALAVLSFAASLILIGAVVAGRGAADWRGRFVGSATAVVRASGLESPDAAAARAAEALQEMPGVARAWPLDPASADGVIAHIEDGESNAAGAPRLVAVEFKAGRAPGAALSRALRADGLDATVDDHRLSSSPVLRSVGLAGLATAGLLALIAVAVGATVAFATHRRIAAQIETVDLLRLAGAADAYIGALFAADASRAVAWGGAAGATAATLTAAVWRLVGAAGGSFPLAWVDLAAVVAWPLIALLVGILASRLAVRAAMIEAP